MLLCIAPTLKVNNNNTHRITIIFVQFYVLVFPPTLIVSRNTLISLLAPSGFGCLATLSLPTRMLVSLEKSRISYFGSLGYVCVNVCLSVCMYVCYVHSETLCRHPPGTQQNGCHRVVVCYTGGNVNHRFSFWSVRALYNLAREVAHLQVGYGPHGIVDLIEALDTNSQIFLRSLGVWICTQIPC